MAAAVASFNARKDEIITSTSRSMKATKTAVSETIRETKVTSTLTTVNKQTLLTSLENTDISERILSHQVAANTVHARELASLQLKYAPAERKPCPWLLSLRRTSKRTALACQRRTNQSKRSSYGRATGRRPPRFGSPLGTRRKRESSTTRTRSTRRSSSPRRSSR